MQLHFFYWRVSKCFTNYYSAFVACDGSLRELVQYLPKLGITMMLPYTLYPRGHNLIMLESPLNTVVYLNMVDPEMLHVYSLTGMLLSPVK